MKLTRALLIFSICCLPATSYAESVYIKDEVYVPLRSGPSSQHRILHKGLKTSTKLELLDKSEDNSWINVKTPSGLVGWVPSHYTLNKPTAALELAETKQDLERLNKRYAEVNKNYQAMSSELRKTKASMRQTETVQQQATMELHRIKSISSGAIELDMKYQKLLEEHELLQTANDTLNAENESLKNDQRFSYMFYGAMLIIAGMFMAVLIPRLKIKKRHSEWAN